MLVFTDFDEIASYVDELWNNGYGITVLEEPSVDERYDKVLYIEMLKDWNWTGKKAKPDWYYAS